MTQLKEVQGERACGFILFTDEPRRYLLLVTKGRGRPEFPKGKLEKGEKAMEAALREVYEETGIEEVEWHEGFQYEFTYGFKRGRQLIRRSAIYFLGKVKEQPVRLGHEHAAYRWLAPEEAIRALRHRNHRRAVQRAEKFLEG